MRQPLKKFTEFTASLLPHETAYLLDQQQFADTDRLRILERIDHNCRQIHRPCAYDERIDKRKYSHLKNWITNSLRAIDVDIQYEWISELNRKIMTDSILPAEERQLLRAIKRYDRPWFFFTHFYELVEHYRQFLLVRMRYVDHGVADSFLKHHQSAYTHAKKVYADLHQATQDIVEQYRDSTSESQQWEDWLRSNYYDEQLDGLNRYQALVRLNFIGFNYRRFQPLRSDFDYLDTQFKLGNHYSKRLLLNYYGNRLLLHSKFQELEEATYYGYLSIRSENHDYLYYLTNLGAVLLRRGLAEEALCVMNRAGGATKQTKNMHVKIGYVSFYIECLVATGAFEQAQTHAETYLRAYSREIKAYRWHRFFSAYLKALLQQRKYDQVLQVIRQHRLLQLDESYRQHANYVPTIPWFELVARYQEGFIPRQRALRELRQAEGGQLTVKTDLRQLIAEHIG